METSHPQLALSSPLRLAAATALLCCCVESILAVTPATVQQGQQLFERNWPTGDPSIGSDGLGPLFNATSCATCHHQGGVGGGGAAEFNANTIGIEWMKIGPGPVNDEIIARMVRSFHPGFIDDDGNVINTLPLAHHGGSAHYEQARTAIRSQVAAKFSESGGVQSALESRYAYMSPIHFTRQIGPHQISLQARLFSRNTTALFGAGLIDQIPLKAILATAKSQQQHAEISGRPSTLKNGRIGKFGWRGNIATLVEFTDQACAAEVGLETRRKKQPRDPMVPAYRNPIHDIDDGQVEALTSFIAALPRPTHRAPSDSSDAQEQVSNGQQLFQSIGCAVCHVPQLGHVNHFYSDLLLHDMGSESIDLSHAEPYVIERTPVSQFSREKSQQSSSSSSRGYAGGSTTVSSSSSRSSLREQKQPFTFVSPSQPLEAIRMVPVKLNSAITVSRTEVKTRRRRAAEQASKKFADLNKKIQTQKQQTRRVLEESRLFRQDFVRIQIQKTNFNQEWRTPPLWGVADSAPYMHDGRAETLLEAISIHEGEAAGTRDRFLQLPLAGRNAIVAFLETLVAPTNAPKAGS